MDYKTKDGIVLKNIPDGTPEDDIKQRINKIRAERGGEQPVEQNQPSDFSFSKMIGNIPGSALQFGKDIVQPIIHPVQTAEALTGLGADIGSKMEDGPNTFDLVKHVLGVKGSPGSAVADALKNRYGGVENVKNTIQTDPVGALGDVAGVLTGAGPALRSGKIAGMAKVIDPVNATVNSLRYGGGKVIPKGLPEKLYESAAKFGTTIDPAKRSKMVQTALKRKIMPTQKGYEKLNKSIGETYAKLGDVIVAADKSGKTIGIDSIMRHVDDLKKKLGGVDNPEALKDLKQIDKYVDGYLKQLNDKGITVLKPSEAQALKQNIYKRVNYDKANLKGNYATVDARKTVAKGAKESLEELDPSIKGYNSEIGDMLELQGPLARSSSRIENRNPIPFDAPMNIAAGGLAADVPGVAAGTALSIFEMPRVKARAAILAEQLRNPNIGSLTKNRLAPMALKQALLQSGRLQLND